MQKFPEANKNIDISLDKKPKDLTLLKFKYKIIKDGKDFDAIKDTLRTILKYEDDVYY